MPIIEAGVLNETPLSQGDILKGVRLSSTKWNDDGGEAQAGKQSLCLVLSRPCVAAHKDRIVVCAIEKYKNSPPAQFESFDEAREFYVEIRDGLRTPDLFYLGQIPNYEGSFCARFDLMHTIFIPPDGSPERTEFIRSTRVGRLNQEFAHDLHLRHVRAFASLGFDDHRWFSDDDLLALLTIAERDISRMQTELLEIQSKLAVGSSQSIHQSQKEKLEKDAKKLQEKIHQFDKEIRPFKDELDSRKKS